MSRRRQVLAQPPGLVRDLGPIDLAPYKLGEPWVRLENGNDLATWSREDEIEYNQTRRQAEKHEFFASAYDYLTDNRVYGTYLEFGCHRARTFRMALTEARKHNLDMKFWAFDSFEGLPDSCPTAREDWVKGALTTTEEQFKDIIDAHGLYEGHVGTVKGFYSGSLNRDPKDFGPACLVNVDCDLFESAQPVFKFIEPILQEGAVIYLDDYFCGYRGNPTKGVAGAWKQYTEQSQWKFERFIDVSWWGRSYIAYPKSKGGRPKKQ